MFWLTVRQSSARMPPVSPEFGFHDQYAQLMSSVPAAMSMVPLLSKSPDRYEVMASNQMTSFGSCNLVPNSPTQIGAMLSS